MYIYRFIDKEQNIVYVGKTVDLKSRMKQHFGGSGHLSNEVYLSVVRVDYLKVETKADMDLLELFFINKYKPKNNIVSKTQDKITVELEKENLKWVEYKNYFNDKKDTHCLGWNNNKGNPTYFTKNYKTFGREVKKTMTMNENALLFVLSDYLESETNRVVIDNKNPSNKVLAEIMGTSVITISRTISSLKDKNLIQSVGSGLGREIYINPLLMFDGKDIKITTLKLFKIKYKNSDKM